MFVIVKDTETQHKLAQMRDLMIELTTNGGVDLDILTAVAEQVAAGFTPGVRVATAEEAEFVELLGAEIKR